MWPNDGEVLETLRRRGVRNVDQYPQVVSDGAHSAFKGAGQSALRQLELKREVMVSSWHDGDGSIVVFIYGSQSSNTRDTENETHLCPTRGLSRQ